MDQIRIGKFIAACRRENGLTQAQLAERLSITDRAVSKWETGRSMPDSSIMLPLCGILGITVNELLSGERIEMMDYNRNAEENLVAMKRREEEQTRMLLKMEWVIGFISVAAFLGLLIPGALLMENVPWAWVLIVMGCVIFAVGMYYSLKLEREAGYYVCAHCGYAYVPDRGRFVMAMHMGRTRYLKCPRCGKRSWQKKAITREESQK